MITSFLGGVLCKLISFHSVDINGRKNVSYYVKGLFYKYMQGDICYCIAYRYARRCKHMQGDIFYCIAFWYAKRYKHMQGDLFIVLHICMEGDVNCCIKR